MTPELMAVFTAKAKALGYEVIPGSDEVPLYVNKGEIEVCQFAENGGMRYYADSPLAAEREQLNTLMRGLKQVHDLYADARPLALDGIDKEDGFRLVSEFGDTLLAAKLGKDNEVRFTTWQYDYDRKGVHWGHYYETNYEGAKRDFVVRAGLIDELQLFSKEELTAPYAACVFRGRNDGEISYEDNKKLDTVIAKIQYNIPEILFSCRKEEQEEPCRDF